MILVTGGTGLVGSHLLYFLLKKNDTVRAIYRRAHKLDLVKEVFSYYSEDFEELFSRIEWIEADINDIPQLEIAFQQIEFVYHCAAFVSFEPNKYHLLRKINIEGTANIVNLCIVNQVKKLCYVSSIAALGKPDNIDLTITEKTKWNPEADNSVYAITKYGAEIEVWRGSQENLNVVVVNPGVIIGPGYFNGGGSSSLIKKVYKGMRFYTNGSTGYVDVWDVVKIMVSLMESEIKNDKFILVSENLTFKNFLETTAAHLGVAPPKKKADKTVLALAWRLDWLNQKLLGKRRKLSKQMAENLQTETSYSNEKIKESLDYNFISIQESIKRTCDIFLAQRTDNS